MKDNECDKHVASGNVVNPCYLWIPYLQIHTLAKIHPECPHPNQYLQCPCAHLWTCMDVHRMAKSLSRSTCIFPVEVEQGDLQLSCFSSHTGNKRPFHHLLSVCFLHGFAFCCFKCSPSAVLK